tara:strand:+ start:85 stop:546 length:462 start_codon:yes stop_codon:yes gene_type:complete
MPYLQLDSAVICRIQQFFNHEALYVTNIIRAICWQGCCKPNGAEQIGFMKTKGKRMNKTNTKTPTTYDAIYSYLTVLRLVKYKTDQARKNAISKYFSKTPINGISLEHKDNIAVLEEKGKACSSTSRKKVYVAVGKTFQEKDLKKLGQRTESN